MKILTFRRMLGLAVIGVAYVHGKRGGGASFASVADTVRYLWSSAADRLGIAGRAQRGATERTITAKPPAPNGLSEERTPGPEGV